MANTNIFIPLWYEIESKRLKNDETENISYGWTQCLFDEALKRINMPVEIEDDFEEETEVTPFD